MSELSVGQLRGLTVNSNVITVPTGHKLSAPGHVVQVVQGSFSTQAYSTSGSFVDTGLTATITPTSASSKILVLVSQGFAVQHNNGGNWVSGEFAGLRGTTQLQTVYLEARVGYGQGTVLTVGSNYSLNFLDSPSTTSATVYKTQFKNGGTGTYANYNNTLATITLMEIAQ
jgi:hypothetical protein